MTYLFSLKSVLFNFKWAVSAKEVNFGEFHWIGELENNA